MTYRPPEFTVCPDTVRRYRARRGLTQEQLAHAATLARLTVINVETRKHRSERTTVDLLARALGVSAEELLEEER